VGLAGIVTALSHDGWLRSRVRHLADYVQADGYEGSARIESEGRLFVWYNLCTLLVAAGLFLNGLGSEPRAPAWTLVVWGAMVALSFSTLILTARSVWKRV
jgi:hypothetical protein